MTALDTKALLTGVSGEWSFTTSMSGDYSPSVYTSDGFDPLDHEALGSAQADVHARLIASAPRLARRVIELEEALASAFCLMGTTTDCLNSGEPSRHRYAEQRLQREMDTIRAILRQEVAALKGEGE